MAGHRAHGAQPAPVPSRARSARRPREHVGACEPAPGGQGVRTPCWAERIAGQGTKPSRRPRQLLLPPRGRAPGARRARVVVVDDPATAGRLRRVDRQSDEPPPRDRGVRRRRTRTRPSSCLPGRRTQRARSCGRAAPRTRVGMGGRSAGSAGRDLQRDQRRRLRLARRVAHDRRIVRDGRRRATSTAARRDHATSRPRVGRRGRPLPVAVPARHGRFRRSFVAVRGRALRRTRRDGRFPRCSAR